MTKHDEDGIDTCLNSVGEAKLLWLDVALWWGEVQFYFVMYGYIVLQANLSKLRCFILWNTKATGPKTKILQSYKEQILYKSIFQKMLQVWVLSTLQNWKKLLLRPIVKLCLSPTRYVGHT